MSRASDQLQDAPDAVTYLNFVKLQLATDEATLRPFLAEVGKWVQEQKVTADGVHNQDFPESILRIVSILRFKPKLLHGINALLEPPQRVEYLTTVDEVKYFVLISQAGARIFSTFSSQVPYPSSDHELRKIIISKSGWKDLLKADFDKDWLTCISQLLQVILDDPSTNRENKECAPRAFRCLRELAEQSILPPSIFINNLNPEENGQPVQGGSSADIYKGNLGKLRGAPVCFRVLRMFETQDRNRLFKEFCSELLLWRQLRHPNILPLMGANLELFAPRFCFISPWLHNGDIMSYLKQHPKHDRFTSICEIVNGIEYLHELDPSVTHKDIKGANVLVGDDLVCRLADFGLSSIVESQRLGRASPPFAGSVCWMAPELMDPSLSKVKNPKAGDIYALGCTIYEIYTGKAPFSETYKNRVAIMFAVLEGQRPALPPPGRWTGEEDLWWLVGLCWKQKPEDRPDMRLIKRTLQDIGTFKPTVTQKTILKSPVPHDSINRLTEIEHWLTRECEEEAQLPSHTIGVEETPRDMSSYHDPRPDLSNGPNETRSLNEKKGAVTLEPNVCQPYSPGSSRPRGREKSLRLSFSSQDMQFSGNSQGLLTPNTPSIPLAPLDLQSLCASPSVMRSDSLTSTADGEDAHLPPHGRNNVGTQIATTELTCLPSSPSAVIQLRPFGTPSIPTPPSTPLPPHSRYPASRLTCDISVKPSQAASANAETRVLRSEPSDTPIYCPPANSLLSNRPSFLPVHLRSNIKYGARPRVNKLSSNPSRVSSFSPAPSPLNQIAQSIHPPCNFNHTSIPEDTPHGNSMLTHVGSSQSSMLPILRHRPLTGPSSASSSKR